MTKNKLNLLLALALFLGGFHGAALAEVFIEDNYTGTVVVTSREGNIELYEEGDPIGPIAVGSYLEVFDGKFTVTATKEDQVALVCLGHEGFVGGGSATLVCGEDSGKIEVLNGEVSIVNPEGITTAVTSGRDFVIQGVLDTALPATATGTDAPTPPLDATTVDSRNIEASPFS